MLDIAPTHQLTYGAELSLSNMKPYYEHYGVDWDLTTIEQTVRTLDNYDLLWNGQRVGIMRLSFNQDICHIRDLQIEPRFQNKGIGAAAKNTRF